jgi:predicted ester cyclase
MSKEKNNKAAVRRFYEEVINKKNMAVIPELIAPNYVFHMTPEIKGPEGVKNYFTPVFTAFPDWHEKIDYMFAEGDMVATFTTFTGTFTGKWGDIAPTGKKVTSQSANLCRLEAGKQVEVWGIMNALTIYQQAGIPIPQQ